MDKIKNWASNHKAFTIISLVVFFLFILPPFMNWVVTTPSWLDPLGFINNDNRNAWIGFYGAIIGGGITLGGVAWTISNQNRKRLDDTSASIIADNYEIIDQINDKPNIEKTFVFHISNIGKTRAINLKFSNSHLFVGLGDNNLIRSPDIPVSYSSISTLDCNDKSRVLFTIIFGSENGDVLNLSTKDIYSVTKKDNHNYTLSMNYSFDVTYENIFSRKHLIRCYFMCLIDYNEEDNNRCHIFYESYYHKTIY